MKKIIFINLIILILHFGLAIAQDYLEYINYFIQDVSLFNSKLSESMAKRIPVMANIVNPDASSNLSGHIFTGGINIGATLTPNFYYSLTQDANYKLIDISKDIGIESDLNYLPLPSFTIFGKVNTFSGWSLGAKINFIPTFERENFKFDIFTFTGYAQKSLLKLGNESGISLSPFFTYCKGSASYLTDPYSVPFTFNDIDFSINGVLNFNLNFNFYSLGAEAKASQKLLFIHPYVGGLVYTNFGEAKVGTRPSIELRIVKPPQLLLKTDLAYIEEKGSPQVLMLNVFGGLEFSMFILKMGVRLDYEIVTDSFSVQLGVRFII